MTKPILSKEGSANLSALLRERKRKNPLTQMPDKYWVKVPDTPFVQLAGLGRKKYSAIVYVAHMSLRWKGWKSKKREAHIDHGVMLTPRFMEQCFGYNHNTIESAIQTLKQTEALELIGKSVYSGRKGQNKGNTYKPLWMYEKSKKRYAWLFWGPFTSEAFLSLDIVSQAIFTLLHLKLYRKKNILTCHPGGLDEFGVNRNIVTKHLERLMHTGLLEHVDGHDYSFPWLTGLKEVDTSQLKYKPLHINRGSCAHNFGQESAGK